MFNTESLKFVMSNILSKRKYILIALGISALFYIAAVIVFQAPYLAASSFASPFNLLFTGFYYFVGKPTFYMTLAISILTGILFTLLAYRMSNFEEIGGKKAGIIASIGIFLGIAAPGCATCGIGLAVALGLSSSLAFLPFQGLELSVISILLLSYSIHKVSSSFISCKV